MRFILPVIVLIAMFAWTPACDAGPLRGKARAGARLAWRVVTLKWIRHRACGAGCSPVQHVLAPAESLVPPPPPG